MSYDELELDKLGDEKSALFFLISDTDTTYNFLVALAFSQMFNLLCERADNTYVINVSPLQEKINKTIRNESEVEYHKDNEAFLKTVLSEFKMLTGEADA